MQHQDLFGVKTLEEVIKIKGGYLSKKTSIYIGKQKPQHRCQLGGKEKREGELATGVFWPRARQRRIASHRGKKA